MRTIISRAGWHARPFKHNPSKLNKRKVKGIALHHSGVKNGPKGVIAVQAFDKHHVVRLGWNAIAYNWLVDEQGVIYEGRGAGIVSAATRPWNTRTESICYTGNGDEPVPEKALESVRWLVGEIQKRYGFKLWVKGHRDLASTACPGSFLYNWLQAGMPTSANNVTPKEWEGVKAHLERLRATLVRKPLSKRRRSRGEAVRAVQQRLKELGYDPGPVDAIFGPKSARAVRDYQYRYRDVLIVDGIVGPQTWKMLFS